MKIVVLLFASVREAAGEKQVELEVPPGATPVQVAAMMAARYPQLDRHLSSLAFAVDGEFVAADTRLQEGKELALLPPVSGG